MAGAIIEFAGGPGAWVTKTYSAAQGRGATLNGSPISVSREADVGRSLLVRSLWPWTAPAAPCMCLPVCMLAAAPAWLKRDVRAHEERTKAAGGYAEAPYPYAMLFDNICHTLQVMGRE